MAGGPLQAADDMVRIITNGLTFGIADKIASGLGDKDAAAKSVAARNRAGLAGDVADVGANLYGAGGALKLGAMGLRALPKIGGAILSKKGLGAALAGLGGLAEYNGRTSADTPTPSPTAAPKTKAGAAPMRGSKNSDAMTDSIMAGLNAVDATPTTFDDMARTVSAANGGISLRQLNALSEVARNTATKQPKLPRPQDTAIAKLQSYYDGLHEQEIASGVPQAQADANWAGRYEGLAKMNPLDALIRNQPGDDD